MGCTAGAGVPGMLTSIVDRICSGGGQRSSSGGSKAPPQRRQRLPGGPRPADGEENPPSQNAGGQQLEVLNTRAFIPDRVNAQISRRYSLQEQEIGSGGFGRVFVAEDREIRGRRVAIKQMESVRRSRRRGFRKEATVMRSLDHPNICKLLETYYHGTSMYLVMEYCDGGELFNFILESGDDGLDEDVVANVVRQIAGALKYAHSLGVAHRDLKPENICFVNGGEQKHHVKVIDWGLSGYFCRIAGGQRQVVRMHSNVGSTAYAAPEVLQQAADEPPASGYSSACDLWSLGVLTYVSLSGSFPFQGKTSEQQLANVLSTDFSEIAKGLQGHSKTARDFVEGLLRINPTQRMTSDHVLAHPWLRREVVQEVDGHRPRPGCELTRGVLAELHRANGRRFPVSVIAAVVARQMDHQSLRELPQVFLDLDVDGSGELDVNEVRRGFESLFGQGSPEVANTERTFAMLDLDGSGTLSYTEFCAAGLVDRLSGEDSVVKAAFMAFDVHDDDGRITRTEFEEVLANARVSSADVCAAEVFGGFDADGDGMLDYQEWKAWVDHLVGAGRGSPRRCGSDLATTASQSSASDCAEQGTPRSP